VIALRHGGNSTDDPRAKKLLVLGETAAATTTRRGVCSKRGLQTLANQLGSEIRLVHCPVYCSECNSIENRRSPHVMRGCRGAISRTLGVARYCMARTDRITGMKVEVSVLDKVYETGRTCAAGFKESMRIAFDKLLPKWNYRVVAQPTGSREVILGLFLIARYSKRDECF
jgi:hypothetical protein